MTTITRNLIKPSGNNKTQQSQDMNDKADESHK